MVCDGGGNEGEGESFARAVVTLFDGFIVATKSIVCEVFCGCESVVFFVVMWCGEEER